MYFTDTHTHLFVEEFDADRDEIIRKATENGIKKMILPGINPEYFDIQKQLAEKYPDNCFIAAGLHPSDVKENFEKELEIVKSELNTGKYIAAGEIGIDLYWDKTFKQQQITAFEEQIKFALTKKLPVIIHVRNSFKEVFEITDKYVTAGLKGIFHSFTGGEKEAEKIISYKNFKIGINGIVTFKNSGLDKTVSRIDLKHIVLETDSPYLSPVPKRGKRNESMHLIYIAEKIAEIKSVSLKELSEITNENAEFIFGNL